MSNCRNTDTMSKLIPEVWVDADSCPVQTEIVEVSRAYGITPRFIATVNHFSSNKTGESWTFLDDGSQSVDLYIINHVQPGDIVITQDLSLAVLLTAKRVYVLTPRGKLVEEDDANVIMDQKYIRQKTMKRKKKWKGPSAFTKNDREHFRLSFEKLLSDYEGIR